MTHGAEQLEREHEITEYGVTMPVSDYVVVTDDPRGAAVAKFREIADRLASGELRAARVEWREGAGITYVEALEHQQIARLVNIRFEAPKRPRLVEV